MIEELVSRVFSLRNAAHLAHWSTRLYAQHMALGDFYDDIIEQTDKIVETYQGLFGLIGDVGPLPYSKDGILEQIGADGNWINQNREALSRGHDVLENQIDELGKIYAQTYYKLKFLQ